MPTLPPNQALKRQSWPLTEAYQHQKQLNNNADINISYKKNITQTTNMIGHAIQGAHLIWTPKQAKNWLFGPRSGVQQYTKQVIHGKQ